MGREGGRGGCEGGEEGKRKVVGGGGGSVETWSCVRKGKEKQEVQRSEEEEGGMWGEGGDDQMREMEELSLVDNRQDQI